MPSLCLLSILSLSISFSASFALCLSCSAVFWLQFLYASTDALSLCVWCVASCAECSTDQKSCESFNSSPRYISVLSSCSFFCALFVFQFFVQGQYPRQPLGVNRWGVGQTSISPPPGHVQIQLPPESSNKAHKVVQIISNPFSFLLSLFFSFTHSPSCYVLFSFTCSLSLSFSVPFWAVCLKNQASLY